MSEEQIYLSLSNDMEKWNITGWNEKEAEHKVYYNSIYINTHIYNLYIFICLGKSLLTVVSEGVDCQETFT